jgi:proteasome activator subunit 4
VIALFENLPDEGGKRNTTGGKQEENVLKSIKNMIDVLCLHLSDQLFDLVLRIVFDYATTNAKSNSVKAIGQLVACLSRAKPDLTIGKFLPFCIMQIEEELRHGASSVRTTATHALIPSDTTFQWRMYSIQPRPNLTSAIRPVYSPWMPWIWWTKCECY